MGNKNTDIVKRLKNKKTRYQAFQELVVLYQERLYWHIRRMVRSHDDADDVLQNTFLKVWKNIESFRAESELFTWLYRIASNESITFLNQKKKKMNISVDDDNMFLYDNASSDDFFEGDEIQQKLQDAIDLLPEKQKLVFNLKYFEEMKYDEMAKILDTSVGALKASYHHAVKKIEAFLVEKVED